MNRKLSSKKIYLGFPGGTVVKNLPANAGDTDVNLTPGSGRSPEVGVKFTSVSPALAGDTDVNLTPGSGRSPEVGTSNSL